MEEATEEAETHMAEDKEEVEEEDSTTDRDPDTMDTETVK